jgi:hypothetical protein
MASRNQPGSEALDERTRSGAAAGQDDRIEWGPIGEPVQVGAASPGDPVYRDNAFLAFWSLGAEPVYGEGHVSTSPNSDGRRARFTICHGGRVVELREELEPDSFRSESIDFDPRGRLVVEAEGFSAHLSYRPRFCHGDYTENAVLGTVRESTLKHYQQGMDVSGTVAIGDETMELECRGIRDRTFGYRDEPRQWIDGVGFCATFDDFDFTAIRNITSDGEAVTDGFILSDSGALRLTGMRFTYDPILLKHAALTFEDGTERTISRRSRQYCPLWFPQGPDREAPGMTSWSEYCEFDAWGAVGEGLVGHWVRRLV